MKTRLLLTLLLSLVTTSAASFTEFYVQTTGSNLNAGSTTNDAAVLTVADGNWTNNTSASVGTFYKSGIDLSGVSAGMWASVYTNSDTTTRFVGRVTAVDDTADTVTISIVSIAGTNPSSGVGDRSLKIGGAWAGPGTGRASTNDNFFPFNFAASTLTNTSGNVPKVWLKGPFAISNAILHSLNGPLYFHGYTNTPGDDGLAAFTGSVSDPAFTMLALTGTDNGLLNMSFSTNGNTSSAKTAVSSTGAETMFERCSVSQVSGYGFVVSGGSSVMMKCEASFWNLNGGGAGAFQTTGVLVKNCIAHESYTALSRGFEGNTGDIYLNCIAYHIAGDGFRNGSSSWFTMINCDSYSNTVGLALSSTSLYVPFVANCNFFRNKGCGITNSGSSTQRIGYILNCGFGSGSMTNLQGNIHTSVTDSVQNGIIISNSFTYPADQTPWVDPDKGNFSMAPTASTRAIGFASFLQTTVNSPTNTISYADIGAASIATTNATSSGGSSHVFIQ